MKEARVPPLVIRPVGIHLVEEIPEHGHEAFSDYDAFRQAGVPFLFLSAGRSPRYHSPGDVPDSLNYERMVATVPWLGHLLALIDLDERRYEFDADRLELADEVETFRVLINQAAGPGDPHPGDIALVAEKTTRRRGVAAGCAYGTARPHHPQAAGAHLDPIPMFPR
jgi:hypothetical protein